MRDAKATHSMREREAAEERKEVVLLIVYIPMATTAMEMQVPSTARLGEGRERSEERV